MCVCVDVLIVMYYVNYHISSYPMNQSLSGSGCYDNTCHHQQNIPYDNALGILTFSISNGMFRTDVDLDDAPTGYEICMKVLPFGKLT